MQLVSTNLETKIEDGTWGCERHRRALNSRWFALGRRVGSVIGAWNGWVFVLRNLLPKAIWGDEPGLILVSGPGIFDPILMF